MVRRPTGGQPGRRLAQVASKWHLAHLRARGRTRPTPARERFRRAADTSCVVAALSLVRENRPGAAPWAPRWRQERIRIDLRERCYRAALRTPGTRLLGTRRGPLSTPGDALLGGDASRAVQARLQ